jgi:hypothetical protein
MTVPAWRRDGFSPAHPEILIASYTHARKAENRATVASNQCSPGIRIAQSTASRRHRSPSESICELNEELLRCVHALYPIRCRAHQIKNLVFRFVV